MRVIAGRYRGMQLRPPEGRVTRPITDRVKESLFNILGSRYGLPGEIPEFNVLDLFAGSGGLGIESISRGARSCVFVERDRAALAALTANLALLKGGVDCRIVKDNAWTARLTAPAGGFGIIFLDPPYRDAAERLRVIDLLARLGDLLAPEGVIVFRYSTKLALENLEVSGLTVADKRDFGGMGITFLTRTSQPGNADHAAQPAAE